VEKFNHYMMTLARDARGMTQSGLAEAIRVQQGTVSKYETGFHDPPPEFVDDLSDALGYPQAFFFEPGRPHGLPPFHYRRRKKLQSKALGRIVAEMNIRRMHLSKLLISFNWKTNRVMPEIDPDDYRGRSNSGLSPEEVATQIRELWQLPNGPISNMIE
jgi:transcriptional regulator with XRE-family HTH domain